MVLFPRRARSRSNKSGKVVSESMGIGDRHDIPCSARGSSEALGSSKRRRPTGDSVSEASERINVRELVIDKARMATMSVT